MVNPYQFSYPEKGWSTGKMRKRGEKLAMMPGDMLPGMSTDPMRGRGLTGGGSLAGQSPLATPQMEQVAPHMRDKAADAIGQIKEHLNDIAIGDATMGGLRKLMKKLGWTGNPENGQFTDPEGKTHSITADTDANSTQGSDAAGPRR